jgi:hypothetical protein
MNVCIIEMKRICSNTFLVFSYSLFYYLTAIIFKEQIYYCSARDFLV